MEQFAVNQMKTALFSRHQALGAKIIDFNGWLMPLHYSGVVSEHNSVREGAGLFDVSHMGMISICGSDASAFIEQICTNTLLEKESMTATYSVFADEKGASIDDAIIYKKDKNHFFTIVNAGNREKALAHMKKKAKSWKVEIEAHYSGQGIIALQGPKALSIIKEYLPAAEKLAPFRFCETQFHEETTILSHTGYTGAGGVEIFGSNAAITALWDSLIATEGVSPVGLGARDTLRMEMGYALYGHELANDIAAVESVSSWTVKFSKPSFIGKEAMQKLMHSTDKRTQYGVVIEGKAIARAGYPVLKEGRAIGIVTSGTFSPTIQKAIALVMVQGTLDIGENIEVQIRGSAVAATVAKLPFITEDKG